MSRQLFGTDGIRGVAGEYPLDAVTAHALGLALGRWAKGVTHKPEVLIGMDTRESGPWLAAQVAGGLREAGVTSRFAGLITTPGVAYLTRTRDFVAGVMISASHNPYRDNGIKVFDHSGFKLPDDRELVLEKMLFEILEAGVAAEPAQLTVDAGLDAAYVDFLVSTMSCRLNSLNIVLDCANGAASEIAPKLFERLGAKVASIGCSPDGRNINLDCGALHLEQLRQKVVAENADLGVAFDGDADRCMLVSRSGKIIDGDAVMLIVGSALQEAGKLPGSVIVSTVMSNLGLERLLRERGIEMIRTQVGDKYVLEEMLRRKAALGGEQSGHVIFTEHATTGDGILTALRVLEIVSKSGRSLDELTEELKNYPQILVNVRVARKKPLTELPMVQEEIRKAEAEFAGKGRVLVRFSGTESLARVMVEGEDLERVPAVANRIADVLRAELAAGA
ncbi:MAG TPA: phosphoglucosamine mutase [Bryobacteraceae bacterium]|nr:phosphoglucosamine mutase [Bryobacteraceae bacterium]